jgi:hypothetical protein
MSDVIHPSQNKPKGPYTLWQDYGYDGWGFEDYESLDEAVRAPKYASVWVISRPVDWGANEKPPT